MRAAGVTRCFSPSIKISGPCRGRTAPEHAHVISRGHPARCSPRQRRDPPRDSRNDPDEACESGLNKDHSARIPSQFFAYVLRLPRSFRCAITASTSRAGNKRVWVAGEIEIASLEEEARQPTFAWKESRGERSARGNLLSKPYACRSTCQEMRKLRGFLDNGPPFSGKMRFKFVC